ncbi:MAG: acetyl/propionyl/methylcrotonyl-CoA carboxylase subunit alpha [Pikeienuella sp.]
MDTVLVANRGEIACRVIRGAHAAGLRAVAVYSEADAEAPHVAMADVAVCIGAAPVGASYLRGDAIIAAAEATGATMIHPGYGFLSENADFADAVAAAGLVFIGPPAAAIRAMGDKAAAKQMMLAAGVPCVPGYQGDDQSDATLIAEAAKIGAPVMVKAAAGGGGRGMRLVDDLTMLPEALSLARAEAKSAFGADHLILERAVVRPRHVELQVFADAHGNCIHLGERDCSVQRRHQKVVEEAPCPAMTPELRDAMGAAAVAAAKAVDYRGAGTVEFLLDDGGAFYFLEMNTRLQVEHPVTEMVTGLDLVAMQIAVAQGGELPLTQDDVVLTGHAIEVRLYAEDPANNFLPAIGAIEMWSPANSEGVRVDAGIATGGEVTPFYDPMLAKIIAHGPTRDVARRRLIRALRATVLIGPKTNASFLIDILSAQSFADGQATTAFIAEVFPGGVSAPVATDQDAAVAAAIMLSADRDVALARAGMVAADQVGWSSAAPMAHPVELVCGDDRFDMTSTAMGLDWSVVVGENRFDVGFTAGGLSSVNGVSLRPVHALTSAGVSTALDGIVHDFARVVPGVGDDAAAGGRITAPMPGVVISVGATVGQAVAKGDVLAVLEAMKMQHQIAAPICGVVKEVAVEAGAQLRSGDVMFEIEAEE